jgi:riboflavin kinase
MATRPRIVGPETGPEGPYPLKMEGTVISGFGRGSKEVSSINDLRLIPYILCVLIIESLSQLGIPTANLPVDATITPWIESITSGVYFGYAALALPSSHPDRPSSSSGQKYLVYPMVMSIGYNPFYKNTVRSAEVHVLSKFTADFYDVPMRLLILGFIREEKDYNGLEALIEDINIDCEVARTSLLRKGWTPREGVVGREGDQITTGELDGAWLVQD